jgi:iron-sulfur cluster repair protein YtfE (RIC family)
MSSETSRNIGTDLIRVHKVITRAITVSNWYSRASGPQDALREGFQSYERALGIFLNSHHISEDEAAFPFIEKKAPHASFEQLREDHRQIVVLIEKINDWLDKGAAAWEAGQLEELNKCVKQLEKIWYTHIALEEQLIGPKAIERLLTVEENVQLGAQISAISQQHAQPAELVLPFMLYNMPADDRAAMAQTLPPVITEQLIPFAWKATWAPMQPFLLD